jgi:hypothetical protein
MQSQRQYLIRRDACLGCDPKRGHTWQQEDSEQNHQLGNLNQWREKDLDGKLIGSLTGNGQKGQPLNLANTSLS